MDVVFLAAGANAEAGAFDEFSGRVAYASERNVVIVDDIGEEHRRSFRLLPDPPAGQVHSVQFVGSDASLLIGADDGSVRAYQCIEENTWSLTNSWTLPAAVMICREFEGLKLAITSKAHLYAIAQDQEAKVIFSAGAGKKLTSLACGKLPDGSLILAVGMSDCSIRLLTPQGKQLLSLVGHQNWTTSLQFQSQQDSLMLLSASLDKTVRLWKISSSTDSQTASTSTTSGLRELVPQQNTFGAWRCEMDAVALGHENAVYFARFVQDASGSTKILSGSADRSIILWRAGFAGSWISEAQLAEASDYTLLFVGGSLIEQGRCLVAVSSTGALMLWRQSDQAQHWTQSTPITGHTGAVEQCFWLPASPQPILLSCSADQTTRAFSTCARLEISRPQIHGYDLKCLALCRREDGAVEMISGADEKVLRVFAAPDQFYTRAALETDFTAPAAAQLPALGLSNKLLSSTEEGYNSAFTPSTPFPLERELTKQSLWPEVDKLYAHNRELSCLAVDERGSWMASAAKGTKASDAAVCIWKRVEGVWKLQQSLELHNLTVTRMTFSSQGRLLITSRDRSISVLDFSAGEQQPRVVLKGFEAHSRQIWAASWIDAEQFLTGGREGLLKWWRFVEDGTVQCSKQVQFEAGVTAIAVNYCDGVIAVGDERGGVHISASVVDDQFSRVITCADAITDLKWNADMLAVASTDHSIRVLQSRK